MLVETSHRYHSNQKNPLNFLVYSPSELDHRNTLKTPLKAILINFWSQIRHLGSQLELLKTPHFSSTFSGYFNILLQPMFSPFISEESSSTRNFLGKKTHN